MCDTAGQLPDSFHFLSLTQGVFCPFPVTGLPLKLLEGAFQFGGSHLDLAFQIARSRSQGVLRLFLFIYVDND